MISLSEDSNTNTNTNGTSTLVLKSTLEDRSRMLAVGSTILYFIIIINLILILP